MYLSIIIPIYKVEKYIRYTLDSIYNQNANEKSFEVICVNDGTPDNSMNIVEEFKILYNNLHIINQKNEGLSCARNAGLKIAKGDYIWFVDSDDTLEAQSISKVIHYIQSDPKTEIWGFNIVRVQEDNKKGKIEHIILKHKNFNLYDIPLQREKIVHKTHIAPVQRFIFKHSFLTKNNITFYPKIYHEDIEFMSRAFFLSEQIKFINYTPYRYLVRTTGSIMSSINMKSIKDRMTIALELNKYKQKYALNNFEKAYFNDIALFLIRSILKYPHSYETEFKEFINLNHKNIRMILINGLWANCYFKDIKKCIAAIILLIKI